MATESSSRAFAGNGSTVAFETGFRFDANSHLTVTLTASGVTTTKTEGTHYSVTGAGVAAGGTVTMVTAPASGETLTISRNTPILQEVDLRPNGGYLPDTIEESMVDKIFRIVQENRRRIAALEAITTPAVVTSSLVFVDTTFTTDSEGKEIDFPYTIAVTGGSTATGCWAVRLRNNTTPAEVFDSPAAVQWAPGAGNNITLLACQGLLPNTSYTLRLAVVIP